MLSNEVILALRSSLEPNLSNEQRLEYFRLTEEYKLTQFELCDLPILCASDQHTTVVLFGLQCLEYKIKHAWRETPAELKHTIKQSLFQLASSFHTFSCFLTDGKVIILVLSQIFVHLIKREWPQQWPSMMKEFLDLQKIGAAQSKLMMNTFLRLYEDVVQFQDIPQSRRRDILAGINDNIPTILDFSFGLIMDQLIVLDSADKSAQLEAISLCRDAVSMLSGFFDSCRMDSLYQWSSSRHPVSANKGLPCAQLFTRLMSHSDLQLDTLSFLLLLMNRKNHHTSGVGDSSTNFISQFMQEVEAINAFCVLLRSRLSGISQFSEDLYALLKLLSEVFVKLGCHIVSQWSTYEIYAQPCNCSNYVCRDIASHILDGLLQLTAYRIRIVSALTLGFWSSALRYPGPSLAARLHPVLPTIFTTWQFGLMKETSSLDNQWISGVYEPDEYSSFYSRIRSEICKCLSFAAAVWPTDFLQLLGTWTESLMSRSVTNGTDIMVRSNLLSEWSVLELYLEHSLTNLKQAYMKQQSVNMTSQFFAYITQLAEQCLKTALPAEPDHRERRIICATLLVQQLDDDAPGTDDTATAHSLLFSLLKEIFTSLTYNPAEGVQGRVSTAVGQSTLPSRSKSVMSLQLSMATAFFRLAQAQPNRLMPQFSAILSEASHLWSSQEVGVVEKCVLLEAFIMLCFRLQQPITVQSELLKQLIIPVTGVWTATPAVGASVSPMTQILTACASCGGAGLLSLVGLGNPITDQDESTPAVGTAILNGMNARRTIVHSVLWLLAAVRRLVDPITEEQREKLTLSSLEPLLTPTLVILKAFNELWLPENLARVHPTILPAFEMSEHIKCYTLCLQINRREKSETSDAGDKTTMDYLRSFLHTCHDNLLTSFGLLLTGLGRRLYALPTDQLAVALHQGCCAAFEQLPDLKVANLMRLVIRPYILHCPREHLASAIVPLVPPIIGAVVQRLDVRWRQLSSQSEEDAQDEKAVAEEMVRERLTRLLSRACLDMMRLLYTFNGYEPTDITSKSQYNNDALGDEDVDDVQMASEVKSAQPSVSSLGCLAQEMSTLAMNATDLESDPLMLYSLVRCLTWPDSSSCLRAAQWITPLIDLILKTMGQLSESQTARVHLPIQISEHLLFGVLMGLHISGRNAESNLYSLLSAGVHIYTAVEPQAARERLSPVIRRALLATACPDQHQSTGSAADDITTSVKNFEDRILIGEKSLSIKTKRDLFKKLIQPIIGVPLSQRFHDQVCIASLAPLKRPAGWRHPKPKDVLLDDDLALCSLFQ